MSETVAYIFEFNNNDNTYTLTGQNGQIILIESNHKKFEWLQKLDPDKIVGKEFTDTSDRNTYYIFAADVPVVSGEEREVSVEIGTYKRFLKVEIKVFSI